jgi:hypothetical protein
MATPVRLLLWLRICESLRSSPYMFTARIHAASCTPVIRSKRTDVQISDSSSTPRSLSSCLSQQECRKSCGMHHARSEIEARTTTDIHFEVLLVRWISTTKRSSRYDSSRHWIKNGAMVYAFVIGKRGHADLRLTCFHVVQNDVSATQCLNRSNIYKVCSRRYVDWTKLVRKRNNL